MEEIRKLDKVLVARTCPVCGYSHSTPFREIHMMLPEGGGMSSDFKLVACDQCGGVYNDIPESEKIEALYSTYTGTRTHYAITEDERILHESTICFLKKHIHPNLQARILDIGCSYGILLRMLSEIGYVNLAGIDLDTRAVEYLSAYGFDMYNGSIFADYSRSFAQNVDLIVLRHIIEHLYSPRKAIEHVAKYLKPDGFLAIEIPCLDLYPDEALFPGYFVEETHINHFSQNSLLNLMSDWNLVAIERQGMIYPTLRAVFQKTRHVRARPILYSDQDKKNMLAMFANPTEIGMKILGNIKKLEEKEIALWGCGTFAQRLLTHTDLKDMDIQLFVDGNTTLQGKRMMGKIIVAPSVLMNFTGAIVLSGKASRNSIMKDVRKMGLENEMIYLFDI